MSYKNTFITASEDSTATSAIIPQPRNEKPTIASIEYNLIKHNPYTYTQDDVQFRTYIEKYQITTDNLAALREEIFSKPKACFRASPLVKKYGWGIHYDESGKLALYEIDGEAYQSFLENEQITKLKGMRSKRK
ncbi:DUF6157 family protein [Ornithinibacillus contaminans]|uniref:DUF6157 family protein n=1 Tax=Ornithinibacillus contaminans TaxID=694055 RepID=UPI00064D8CAA|nr:DUF6157 family protein [Ornithinibacillus contaminans]